ncbi:MULTISPECIES: hypothetical protein [unclassified Bradyrhizobium]|uniref:hypothetical protein n=1 Tax=unclassified Bradyrhizobium TaxID=2631580 RepID=UPI002916FB9C|nr:MULTISPECIES: hypothetical protein [unclassified Bradyrhizobium]
MRSKSRERPEISIEIGPSGLRFTGAENTGTGAVVLVVVIIFIIWAVVGAPVPHM